MITLLDKLKSPYFQKELEKAIEAEQNDLIEKRQKAVIALKQKINEINPYIIEKEKTEAEIKTLQAELEQKTSTYGIICLQAYNYSLAGDREIEALKAELLNSYDPRLDKEIKYFTELLEDLRKPNLIDIQFTPAIQTLTGRYKYTVHSNKKSILQRIKYLREAINQIEQMKLAAKFDPIAIKKLKEEIPELYSEEIEVISINTPHPFIN